MVCLSLHKLFHTENCPHFLISRLLILSVYKSDILNKDLTLANLKLKFSEFFVLICVSVTQAVSQVNTKQTDKQRAKANHRAFMNETISGNNIHEKGYFRSLVVLEMIGLWPINALLYC